jgi:ribosomal protein S18 acetylase RimI-like enzyme
VNLMIRNLSTGDAEDAGKVLAASMMVEPGYVSILPDVDQRYRILVPLITGTVREAMEHDAAFGAFDGENLVGVSLWMPPGVYPPPPEKPEPSNTPPELPAYLRELDPEALMGLIIFDDRCMEHFPDEPAWYLMYLGVDPSAQGIGVGSTLLRESMDRVLEREGAPIYLETGTERNVRFYEHFGFGVREANLQLAPGPARHWTMMRPAPVPVTTE